MYLITYDVNTETGAGKARLRKIAKECTNYGQRVQKSVFECELDPAQYRQLKSRLIAIMDEDKDSLRFYNLGNQYRERIETAGIKSTYDPKAVLIV